MVYLIKIQKEFLKRGLFFGFSIAHRALNSLLYETRVEHVEVVCDECGGNGRMAEMATYVLFTVHTDDTDTETDDTLIFYSIELLYTIWSYLIRFCTAFFP